MNSDEINSIGQQELNLSRIRRLLTVAKDPALICPLLLAVNIIFLQELIMSGIARRIAQLFVIGRLFGNLRFVVKMFAPLRLFWLTSLLKLLAGLLSYRP